MTKVVFVERNSNVDYDINAYNDVYTTKFECNLNTIVI